jgi:hypothetical protein
VKNLVCLVIIAGILTVIGAIFHGFRMMLLAIYQGMAELKVGFFSFPHILAYFFFFLIADLLTLLATDRIIRILIKFKNPPTDESVRKLDHNIRFFYLLGIELIAPFFFLVL